MIRLNKKEGFASFVEVVITAIIFTLSAVGILASINMLRPHGAESTAKLEAAYVAKGFLEQLRTAVDAQMWDDAGSNLALGSHNVVLNGYTINYVVTAMPDFDPDMAPRRVDLNIYFQ